LHDFSYVILIYPHQVTPQASAMARAVSENQLKLGSLNWRPPDATQQTPGTDEKKEKNGPPAVCEGQLDAMYSITLNSS